MDNLEEMDKYLEKCNFPKLNQEKIENLNKPISNKSKAQDQMASELNSTKNLEQSYHLSYSNSSRKFQRKENFQTHSMRPPSP